MVEDELFADVIIEKDKKKRSNFESVVNKKKMSREDLDNFMNEMD